MQSINPADKVIMQLLGSQKKKYENKVRPLKYTLRLPADKGYILHNFLTGESVFLECADDERANMDYLFAHYFFVYEGSDDLKLTEELRAAIRLINQKQEITSFKILTTTDCNARCSYCYELGMKRIDMSRETALEVVDYIVKNNGGKKTTLAWFGGEPLLNIMVIDLICTELTSAHIEFSSVMTSNGYLITPDLINKAKQLWNLKNIQITLDGYGDMYNKIKAYVNPENDPFERVIKNISDLINNKVRVNIRLNLSTENFEELYRLIDYLDMKFPDKEYLSIYVSGLFQDTEDKKDNNKKKKLYERIDILTKYLYSKGLAKRSRRSLKLRTGGCMADNDSHRGVSPTGMLMKCEHNIFTRLTGNIRDGSESKAALKEWKQRLSYGEACKDCTVLPVCYRLKNCPVSHVCTTEERKQYTDDLTSALFATYTAWKSNNAVLKTQSE